MQKKRFTKLLIQLLICVLLLELFLRVIFYQQAGKEKLAVIEVLKLIKRKITISGTTGRIYNDFLLARPDSTKEINKLIADEADASNHFEYSPWIEYRNIDFAGKYINTKGLIRATVPDAFINTDTTAVRTIWFLGGSTMYGVNVTDRETVAAAFVNQYKEQYPHGVSVKVVNYGISAYHSYNELMLLTHLIYSGEKPDIVIMLDGLNDFLIAGAVQNRLPYYYYRLKLASKDKINYRELEEVSDSTAALFDYAEGYSRERLTDTLMKRYLSNLNQVKKITRTNEADVFFFIQPNPFFNYPNKKNDPICDKSLNPLVNIAYTMLEKKADSTENYFFLGNMLSNEKGYPFIDRFHYSPSMCKKIAKEIVKVVGLKINKH